MAVFPENMNRLPAGDSEKALGTLDDYIRYMRERIEFSFENMTKSVNAVGVSSVALYESVQEALGDLSALSSRVSTHTGNTTIHVTADDKAAWNTQLRTSLRPTASGATLYGTQLLFWTGSAWRSITTSRGTGTSKTCMSDGIPNPGVMLYYSGTSAVASGSQVAAGTILRAGDALDFRYSSNCGSGLTANAPIYLVWSLNANGLYYLASTWWTQSLPSSDDGYIYEYVGEAYSEYQFNLSPSHPMFVYKDGGIKPFS